MLLCTRAYQTAPRTPPLGSGWLAFSHTSDAEGSTVQEGLRVADLSQGIIWHHRKPLTRLRWSANGRYLQAANSEDNMVFDRLGEAEPIGNLLDKSNLNVQSAIWTPEEILGDEDGFFVRSDKAALLYVSVPLGQTQTLIEADPYAEAWPGLMVSYSSGWLAWVRAVNVNNELPSNGGQALELRNLSDGTTQTWP